MSNNVENIMTQDILQYFSIYGDEQLTREIGANDIIDLCDIDNTITLYITLNDYLSINDQGQLCMVIDGEYRVVFFDIVREIEGKFFRNYDLVESIETEFFFDTKPLIENLIKKIDGEPFINVMGVLNFFSFKSLSFKEIKPDYIKGEGYSYSSEEIFNYTNKIMTGNFLVPSFDKKIGDLASVFPKGNVEMDKVYFSKNELDKLFYLDVYLKKKVYSFPIIRDEVTVGYIKQKYYEEQVKNNFFLTEIPEGSDVNPDYLTLIEKIYNTNYIKDCLQIEPIKEYPGLSISDLFTHSALYWNGCLGKAHINILGDIKPTCYIVQDKFKNYMGDFSSDYRLGLSSHEVFQRWAWYIEKGMERTLDENETNDEIFIYNTKTKGNLKRKLMNESIATGLLGLGRVSTIERYNSLYPYLEKDGAMRDMTIRPNYFLFKTPPYGKEQYKEGERGSIWSDFSMQKIIYAAIHNNGDMYMQDRVKNVLDSHGGGTEYNFFVSYDTFCKKHDINLNYITKTDNEGIAEKSYILMESLRANTEIPTKVYCEFYDRNHPAPLDNIYAYVPIPLTPGNYKYKNIPLKDEHGIIIYNNKGKPIVDINKGLYRIEDKIAMKEDIGSNLIIHKRKRSEDSDGNVTIEDLGEVEYPGNTWKIPFNEGEYLYKCKCNAVHTFISRDMKFKIKIKFKKTPNREQNIYFRLFAHDYTFGRMFCIKRKR